MSEEDLENIKNGKYVTIGEKKYREDDPRLKTRLERETEQRERFDVMKSKERQDRLEAIQRKKETRRETAQKKRSERLQIQKEKLEIAKTRTQIAKTKAERRSHSASHTLLSTIQKRRQPQTRKPTTQQRVQKQQIVYIDGVPYIRVGQQRTTSAPISKPKKKKPKEEKFTI